MERERLTITLRKDILKLVDQSIDGAKLRNRSHAIEYYLSQQLAPKTVRVILVVPVEMQTAFGGVQSYATKDLKPIFKNLSEEGFDEIVLMGVDRLAVQSAAIDAENSNLRVKIVNTETRDIGDVFKDLSVQFADESFVFWDARFTQHLNLAEFLDFHRSNKGVATAALLQGEGSQPIGMRAQLYGNRVVQVGNDLQAGQAGLALSGVFAFEPEIFEYTNKLGNFYQKVLPVLAREKRLFGFPFFTNRAEEYVKAAATVR